MLAVSSTSMTFGNTSHFPPPGGGATGRFLSVFEAIFLLWATFWAKPELWRLQSKLTSFQSKACRTCRPSRDCEEPPLANSARVVKRFEDVESSASRAIFRDGERTRVMYIRNSIGMHIWRFAVESKEDETSWNSCISFTYSCSFGPMSPNPWEMTDFGEGREKNCELA